MLAVCPFDHRQSITLIAHLQRDQGLDRKRPQDKLRKTVCLPVPHHYRSTCLLHADVQGLLLLDRGQSDFKSIAHVKEHVKVLAHQGGHSTSIVYNALSPREDRQLMQVLRSAQITPVVIGQRPANRRLQA